MADQTKPQIPKPPIHLGKQLLVFAVLFIIVGVVIIIAGKLIIGGIIALLGAVFGVGSQVGKNKDLQA